MAECRYYGVCYNSDTVGGSMCVVGCRDYEPMPDVDVLIKLADEMDRDADMVLKQIDTDPPYWFPNPKEYARRIREALGVGDA